MKTLNDYFRRDSYYRGERGEWLVASTLNRDSDCLSRSNFRCFAELLGGKRADVDTASRKGSIDLSDSLAIEEASHWACGWIQYLIINPACCELVKIAENTLEKLDGYPVVNEDDWSMLEDEEAQSVWRDCCRTKDRLQYVREHRREFEFSGIADMLSCIRGKHFAGYASELLG